MVLKMILITKRRERLSFLFVTLYCFICKFFHWFISNTWINKILARILLYSWRLILDNPIKKVPMLVIYNEITFSQDDELLIWGLFWYYIQRIFRWRCVYGHYWKWLLIHFIKVIIYVLQFYGEIFYHFKSLFMCMSKILSHLENI